MAKARTPRGAWVEAALKALAAGGPDAVRVEALAAGMGVSKGGFYWHFKDRPALVTEMLDAWEKAGTEEVIARIEREPGDARERIRKLFDLSPTADFEVDLALRDWARRDPAVAARLQGIDTRRLRFLRSLFGQICADEDDAEACSMLAYSLLIGTYFIAARPDGRTRSELMGIALERLLEEGRGR
jgi:AcrR family transcriptional regulator